MCAYIGQEGYRNARLESTSKNRQTYFRYWKNLCKLVEVDPLLDPRRVTWEIVREQIFIFGGFVRQGLCGNRKQVAAGTVSKAITTVGQEIAIARRETYSK